MAKPSTTFKKFYERNRGTVRGLFYTQFYQYLGTWCRPSHTAGTKWSKIKGCPVAVGSAGPCQADVPEQAIQETTPLEYHTMSLQSPRIG
ncbi:hypothetical protein CJ030_MR3G026639 [Morella rubra]|uniref:Uncharacterized protein n=1 Tax=Morella rubra TaxID=262757 RepID=A0A6A1W0I6_9ROSI|nr:hypothetical protein CJ030_MR3G026639 [Morella rubra]